MCGIFSIFLRSAELVPSATETLRELAFRQSGKQRHRGPDYTGLVTDDRDGHFVMMQERLSVLGVKTGNQPFASEDGHILLVANGEIYNYLDMAVAINGCRKRNGNLVPYVPRNDCDVIVAYYECFGVEQLMATIRGMFAFVLYDRKCGSVLIARDPIGIVPLYRGVDELGNLWLASEMKCLVEKCKDVKVFPPGHLYYGPRDTVQPVPYFKPPWIAEVPVARVDLTALKNHLESAVASHLQCDAPMGALLSGGLDSSLVASITTKLMRKRDPTYRLRTYSVGLVGGPDFVFSRMVADYIGSDHTDVYFTIDEGLNYIRDAIYHCETYDITTVRCTIPMLLLARHIKSEGIKMILSGEGADEIFGGYLYFHQAPSKDDFHRETVNRVLNLHYADCLRANKATSAWGLELRVPFLDTNFVNHAMAICPEDRAPRTRLNGTAQKIEKFIVRQAFADGYLPEAVLWRQKEQFSDGVGYSWIDAVTRYAAAHVTDEEFADVHQRYPTNPPPTKEAFYYRKVFEELFPHSSCAATVRRWIPRTDWGCSSDPSGRKQRAHLESVNSVPEL